MDQLIFAIRGRALDHFSTLPEKTRNSWPLLVDEFESQFGRKETPQEMRPRKSGSSPFGTLMKMARLMSEADSEGTLDLSFHKEGEVGVE